MSKQSEINKIVEELRFVDSLFVYYVKNSIDKIGIILPMIRTITTKKARRSSFHLRSENSQLVSKYSHSEKHVQELISLRVRDKEEFSTQLEESQSLNVKLQGSYERLQSEYQALLGTLPFLIVGDQEKKIGKKTNLETRHGGVNLLICE